MNGLRSLLPLALMVALASGCSATTRQTLQDTVGLKEAEDQKTQTLPTPTILSRGKTCGWRTEGVQVLRQNVNTVHLKVSMGVLEERGRVYRLGAPPLSYDPRTETVTLRINEERQPEGERSMFEEITWPCLILKADMWPIPAPEEVRLELHRAVDPDARPHGD